MAIKSIVLFDGMNSPLIESMHSGVGVLAAFGLFGIEFKDVVDAENSDARFGRKLNGSNLILRWLQHSGCQRISHRSCRQIQPRPRQMRALRIRLCLVVVRS